MADQLFMSCEEPNDIVFELDLSNAAFPALETVVSPATDGRGMGGINADDLFHSELDVNAFYKLDKTDLSSILLGPTSTLPQNVQDMGGFNDRLFTIEAAGNIIAERNTTTFAIINSATGPGSVGIGIGGTTTALYAVNIGETKIYKIDPDTLAPDGAGVSVASNPRGCGGAGSRLFMTTFSPNNIVELDPVTLLSLNGAGVGTPSNFKGRGIGGTKGGVAPPPAVAGVTGGSLYLN